MDSVSVAPESRNPTLANQKSRYVALERACYRTELTTDHSRKLSDHRRRAGGECVLFASCRQQRHRTDLLPNDPFGKALASAAEREAGLRVFLDDSEFAIDTNYLERSLRPIPMGRRNWLFAWTELVAGRVRAIQSLLATCRMQAVYHYTYLIDVLQRIDRQPRRGAQAHPGDERRLSHRAVPQDPRLELRHLHERVQFPAEQRSELERAQEAANAVGGVQRHGPAGLQPLGHEARIAHHVAPEPARADAATLQVGLHRCAQFLVKRRVQQSFDVGVQEAGRRAHAGEHRHGRTARQQESVLTGLHFSTPVRPGSNGYAPMPGSAETQNRQRPRLRPFTPVALRM